MSSGRDKILKPSGNEDEFAKGIVGKPSEIEAEQKGGNQKGMGDETLVYGGGFFEQEKVGLEDGVSVRETINLDSVEPEYDYSVDPLTGNAPERKVGRMNNETVKGKRDQTFLMGEM